MTTLNEEKYRQEIRKEILERLGEEMDRYPDMRFGQLIINVLVNMEPIEKQHMKLFYITDEEAFDHFLLWRGE